MSVCYVLSQAELTSAVLWCQTRYPTDVDIDMSFRYVHNAYVNFRRPSLVYNSWIAHRHLTIDETLFSQYYICMKPKYLPHFMEGRYNY